MARRLSGEFGEFWSDERLILRGPIGRCSVVLPSIVVVRKEAAMSGIVSDKLQMELTPLYSRYPTYPYDCIHGEE